MTARPAHLLSLALLYFVQGIPFGFQATALPIFLRAEGISLTTIGFSSALALPWMLKILWAPVVDRFGSSLIGRRRSWILPMQFLLAFTCLVAARAHPDDSLTALLTLVFLMNLFAATMDIAVDGLAVDILETRDLGYGNIAQVVGYKMGMLTGGGLLVWASDRIGWNGLFFAMAAIVALVLVFTLGLDEPRLRSNDPATPVAPPSLRAVLKTLVGWARLREAQWFIAVVLTYKLGESMADAMFKPFLVDAGFGESQIGLWVGTWGMAFSLLGSFAGGVLASRTTLRFALIVTATLRVLPVAGEWWLSLGIPSENAVIAVTCAEHFFGGALTTAMFAFMMARVDRSIGATHFTLIATIEVFGKMPAAIASGALAAAFGYPTVFAAATLLSLAFLALFRRPHRDRPNRGPA